MTDAKPLSKGAQRVLLLANLESKRSGCAHVASEHLLLGALAYRSRTVSGALTKAGLRLSTLRSYIAEVGSAPEDSPHGYGPSMHGALRRSVQHSAIARAPAIEPEHLLLASWMRNPVARLARCATFVLTLPPSSAPSLSG